MAKIPKSVRPNSGVKGMDKILSNLNKEIKAIENRTKAGLIEVSILLREDMENTPPLIPVDTGNLRASWTAQPTEEKGQVGIIMGFTANYALFVHEMVDAEFKRPNSGAKFFEAAIKRNRDQIIQTIQDNAKIK